MVKIIRPTKNNLIAQSIICAGVISVFWVLSTTYIFPITEALQAENTIESLSLGLVILSTVWLGGIYLALTLQHKLVQPVEKILNLYTNRGYGN